MRGAAGSVHLGATPSFGVVGEGHATGLGVDVLASDDRGGDLVEPALCVDLAGEVAGVLAAGIVAVASPPAPIGSLGDVGHRQPSLRPGSWCDAAHA